MIQITHDSINKALDKIDNLSDEQLDQLITEYGEKQEDLLNYVLQAGIDFDAACSCGSDGTRGG